MLVNIELRSEKCKWLTGPGLMHNHSPAEPQAHHPPTLTRQLSSDGAATLHQEEHVTVTAWTLCRTSRAGMLRGKGKKK